MQLDSKIQPLKFGKGNAKLGKDITTFSIPAGYACPGAKECFAKADADTGKISDGPHTKFRCFSASQEALYHNVRSARWHNFTQLLLCGTHKDAIYALISNSLPPKATTVRVHVAGDFYSQSYFDAWMDVALTNPDVVFYTYTKSLHFWVARLHEIPRNFRLTASRGGKFDRYIEQYSLPEALVVFHPDEAKAKGLKIDKDDSMARDPDRDKFALLLHGTQPAGSAASKAQSKMQKQGITAGYSSSKKKAAGDLGERAAVRFVHQ